MKKYGLKNALSVLNEIKVLFCKNEMISDQTLLARLFLMDCPIHAKG
jgi:hypothetical protein